VQLGRVILDSALLRSAHTAIGLRSRVFFDVDEQAWQDFLNLAYFPPDRLVGPHYEVGSDILRLARSSAETMTQAVPLQIPLIIIIHCIDDAFGLRVRADNFLSQFRIGNST
jgi:hypothetical protein